MKKKKKKAKNGFYLSWPNMALRKNLDKSNWSLILRDQTVEGEGKRRRRRRNGDKKGMDSMIFGMDITWKVRILWFCLEF